MAAGVVEERVMGGGVGMEGLVVEGEVGVGEERGVGAGLEVWVVEGGVGMGAWVVEETGSSIQ